MVFLKYILVVYLSCFFAADSWAKEHVVPEFTVYAYIPWKRNTQEQSTLFSKYGIQPVFVIYENKYFTNKKIDLNKIKIIALETVSSPHIPVSFDMEFGNRFKPETVIPDIKATINYFRYYNSKSMVGIYATIPQNTYGKKPASLLHNPPEADHSFHAMAISDSTR